jgi:hypothetical protein
MRRTPFRVRALSFAGVKETILILGRLSPQMGRNFALSLRAWAQAGPSQHSEVSRTGYQRVGTPLGKGAHQPASANSAAIRQENESDT